MKRFFSVLFAAMFSTVMLLGSSAVETEEKEVSQEPVHLPIVMYHQMTRSPERVSQFTILEQTFDEDLAYLKSQGYESITVQQLLDWYDGIGTLPEKPMMITFDDGYETTLTYVEPILRKYGYTAVVAVVAAIADTYTETEDHTLDYSHLSWEDVKRMSESDVYEIQCHTFDMHKLSHRQGCDKVIGESSDHYKSILEEDIRKYDARCEEYGVSSQRTIAYPYGYFCNDTIEALRNVGYRLGFTCMERVNVLKGDPEEMFVLGRFNREPGKSSAAFFSQWEIEDAGTTSN